MSNFTWQVCGILACLALVIVPLAIRGLITMGRPPLIPYRDLNEHRTTPRFDVGADVKDRT